MHSAMRVGLVLFFLSLTTVATVGCGSPNDLLDYESSLDGSVEDFVSRILYRSTGNPSEPFQYLQSEPQLLTQTSAGPVYYDISLFLYPERGYVLVYNEGLHKVSQGQNPYKERIFRTALTGSWSIELDRLLLGASVEATPVGLDQIDLDFRGNLNSFGLRGQRARLTYRTSPISLEDRRKLLTEEPDPRWMAGNWVRKDYREGKESIQLGFGPMRVEQSVSRPMRLSGAEMVDCQIRYTSSNFTVGAEANQDGVLTYIVVYEVTGVDVATSLLRDDKKCIELGEREKRQMRAEGLFRRFDFVRVDEKHLKSGENEIYERK